MRRGYCHLTAMSNNCTFKLFKSGLLQGRMGWLGGLGPCDITRSVNQPFS